MKKAIYFVIVVSGILTLFGLCLQWDSGSVGSGPYISEAVASSPGDVGDGDGDTSRESSQSDDEFHAWLEHPEHVFEANLMQLRVRLFPNTNEFPGMQKADVNRFDDTVVQATVALEDISVPLWNTQIASRPQSHIRREKARGRAALEFCRRAILNASGLLVVAPRYEDSDRLVHCRLVLLDEQGDKVDIGELLVKNGFGSRDVLGLGAGGCLNSCQLSAISGQKLSEAGFTGFIGFAGLGNVRFIALLQTMVSVRSRKSRESEFPPTEESGLQTPPTRNTPIKESGLQTPPTEDNHTLPFPEEIHVDSGVSSLYPFLFFYC